MFPLNSDIVTNVKGSNCYRIHMLPSRGNKFVSLRGGPLPVSLIHYFLQGPRPLNVSAPRSLFICLLLILPWKCSKMCLRAPTVQNEKKIHITNRYHSVIIHEFIRFDAILNANKTFSIYFNFSVVQEFLYRIGIIMWEL